MNKATWDELREQVKQIRAAQSRVTKLYNEWEAMVPEAERPADSAPTAVNEDGSAHGMEFGGPQPPYDSASVKAESRKTDWRGIHNDEGAELLREVVNYEGDGCARWMRPGLWERITAWFLGDADGENQESAPKPFDPDDPDFRMQVPDEEAQAFVESLTRSHSDTSVGDASKDDIETLSYWAFRTWWHYHQASGHQAPSPFKCDQDYCPEIYQGIEKWEAPENKEVHSNSQVPTESVE